MREGMTYTRHFMLEARQHELFGVDLGKGVSRRTMLLGVLAFTVWDGIGFAVFGVPSLNWVTAYFLPPLLLTVLGAQPSRACDRRTVLAGWVIAGQYQVTGHRPVVRGGRAVAHRSEWLSRRARWERQVPALSRALGVATTERLLGGSAGQDVPSAGPVVEMTATARLYGPDHMVQKVVAVRGRKAKGRT
ncbi:MULTISPECIES: hypothetical protein [unclassified Streptomyces]|uniref:hypothetical protein n=1 Tax=unclassified Streptomyces TaxID=2593676 RepID=UPI003660D550